MELMSLEAALARRAEAGVRVRTVIDIGASNGHWARKVMPFFPQADFLLVEAAVEHEPELGRFVQEFPQARSVIAAAGASCGQVYFQQNGDVFGGLASTTPFEVNCRTLPLTTIDHQVARHQLQPPYFLKLDTHGFEVPILQGAQETLKQTTLIQIEVYNFAFGEYGMRFDGMCRFMEERGFRCVDLCDPLHRPIDQALWQIDLFFIPATSPEFASNDYLGGQCASFSGWEQSEGLNPIEGPYPDWGLPRVRWGLAPRTRLLFSSRGGPKYLTGMCLGSQPKQSVAIRLNQQLLQKLAVPQAKEFVPFCVPLPTRDPANELVLEYSSWSSSPGDSRKLGVLFKTLQIVDQPPL